METILNCQHCGNRTSHTILDEVTEFEEMIFNGEDHSQDVYLWFIKCDTCEKHSLFWDINGDIDEATSIYPKEINRDLSIPQEIHNAYNEAIKVKKKSKIAFLIMIRRSLEILCKNEGAEGKDLFGKIKNLADKNVIPHKLFEMADTIRLLGNTNAHETEIEIEDFDLEILDSFFLAIIEYVYIAPAKIKRLKEKLNK